MKKTTSEYIKKEEKNTTPISPNNETYKHDTHTQNSNLQSSYKPSRKRRRATITATKPTQFLNLIRPNSFIMTPNSYTLTFTFTPTTSCSCIRRVNTSRISRSSSSGGGSVILRCHYSMDVYVHQIVSGTT
mmetsp:Transcript_36145/g.41159  ORF Transcript_36145/g.41159 Transcript_36145/m.41159 type:complete len:131 (-) Transcript_36145:1882-2274(-)